MNFPNSKMKVTGLLGALLFVFLITSAEAQTGQSTVTGIVVDQNDAVVAGASVLISNPATGFSQTRRAS